jgi:hypothetical protein
LTEAAATSSSAHFSERAMPARISSYSKAIHPRASSQNAMPWSL